MRINNLTLKSFVLAIITPLIFTGCLPKNPTGNDNTFSEPITIKIWRTFENASAFSEIFNLLESKYPNISIEYRRLPFEEYELAVSEALSTGEGPDIWSIRNDWVRRHIDKLVPAPNELIISGQNNLTISEVMNKDYVPVVLKDVIRDGRVYGLPLYMDTLVLYKNSDVFRERINELDNAGRREDANLLRENLNTWDKVQKAVRLLTKKDSKGNILMSGLAAGTSNNITVPEDILYAMMLQNGTEMLNPGETNASFHLRQENNALQIFFPGTEALNLYTSFADPKSPFYSWNSRMRGDIEEFVQGKTAMIFGFQYFEVILDQVAPTLNYTAMPFPQVRDNAQPLDYAQYWVETVTKNAKNPEAAWLIVKEIINASGTFLNTTGRYNPRPVSGAPSIIERVNRSDPQGYQGQTATSWFKTNRPDKVDEIFSYMISRVNQGEKPQNAIEEGAQKTTEILRQGQGL